MACSTNGIVTEATFEGVMEFKPSEKYLIPVSVQDTKFKSVKSEILRDNALRTVTARKQEKLAKKKAKLAKMKEDTPGLIVDEGVFFRT